MQAVVPRPVEKHVEAQKETSKGKDKVPSAGSGICQKKLLHEATVKGLDKSWKLLYSLLLTLHGAIEINNCKLFGLQDDAVTWLGTEDVMDIFTDDKINITMMQAFCM